MWLRTTVSESDPYREFYEETGRLLEKWDRQDRDHLFYLIGFLSGVLLVAVLWIFS